VECRRQAGFSARPVCHHVSQTLERLAPQEIWRYANASHGVGRRGEHRTRRRKCSPIATFPNRCKGAGAPTATIRPRWNSRFSPITPEKGRPRAAAGCRRARPARLGPHTCSHGRDFAQRRRLYCYLQMRTDSPGRYEVACQMDHEPWRHHGVVHLGRSGAPMAALPLDVIADRDEPNARLVFAQFKKNVVYQLADVSMRPGGIVGLASGQRLEDDSVPTLRRQESARLPVATSATFLRDTERNYWQNDVPLPQGSTARPAAGSAAHSLVTARFTFRPASTTSTITPTGNTPSPQPAFGT